jgi:hypothetical protein
MGGVVDVNAHSELGAVYASSVAMDRMDSAPFESYLLTAVTWDNRAARDGTSLRHSFVF